MESDLYKFIYNSKIYIKKTLIKEILFKILNGLNYLHSKLLIHRDLSLKNILLSNDANFVKISDFGLSRKVDIINPNYTKKIGTLYYMAPEILLNMQDYTNRVDIWSVGCIFYEMIFKKKLFSGHNFTEQIHSIENILGTPTNAIWPNIEKSDEYKKYYTESKENKFDLKLEGLNTNARDIIKRMIIYNPQERISPKNSLKHVSFIYY